jgi:hypothetical protein
MFDLRYLGIEKDFPAQLSALPCKNKRTIKIYLEMKKSITEFIPKKRILIEHTICRLKKYRLVIDVFMNKLEEYNKISNQVNYRTINHQH